MAPAQFGKDPECSAEQKLREVGVSESSGGTPLHSIASIAKTGFADVHLSSTCTQNFGESIKDTCSCRARYR